MEQTVTRKTLIEVALPLEAINAASAREKSIRHGHPSTLHLWWARRPLATARAVLFSQLVDDPSSWPELFPTETDQSQERQRLFRIIEELVKWESTTNETVLEQAREEIRRSWRRTCEDNRDHPRAAELFNPDQLPAFHDPFAGGGSIPLEAQRLGLEAHASDLNPVAVLINKAMIEIPPRFAGKPPVNPEARQGRGSTEAQWKGATGLAEDVCYYGKWMRDEAEKHIGHLYPKIEITAEMAQERPDMKPYVGRKLTVIAWLWARTVKSPNPAFANVDVPLASSFILSTKRGKEAYVVPVVENDGYRFTVKVGPPPDSAKLGTTAGKRSAFLCLMSGVPVPYGHIRAEGQRGHMGTRLMAIVAEGDNGRIYLAPTPEHEAVVEKARPDWKPDLVLPINPRDFKTPNYGINTFSDLFTDRQLVALTTLSDLVSEARDRIQKDAIDASMPDDGRPLRGGGGGAIAYAEAVGVYLAFLIDQVANHSSSMCGWNSANAQMRSVYARQAVPMVWDYAESNPFCESSGSYANLFERQVKGLGALGSGRPGAASQADVNRQSISSNKLVSTDPPYYDNIGYADLSDFFYIWLRRSLGLVFPDLFATLAVPKAEELIASPYRHGSREEAERFFLDGMTSAMKRLAAESHPGSPVSIYYAFKQSERSSDAGITSTGWETFLEAILRSGFSVRGTWPIRTEKQGRVIGNSTNALASSIILVCRPRSGDAPTATRREFLDVLRSELPEGLRMMQQGNIAPVDLAQAAIGPGMAIFTRYARVLDAGGAAVSVREALALINETLDEALAEQEGTFDADTRWALAWFDQSGFSEGEYGVAETLSTAKNTSVGGMAEAGILTSGAGKVRLLAPAELPQDWNPRTDPRRTVWETTHQLVRVHAQGGDAAAADIMANIGADAETARDLAYRLFRICDLRNRPQEALGYNALVSSWREISSLATQARQAPTEPNMFDGE